MALPTPADREGVKALQRLEEARSVLMQAEAKLQAAMALLEAQDGIRWGALPDHKLSERRQMLLHAHLAWAKLDRCWKTILRKQWSRAGTRLEQGGQDESDRGPMQQDRESHQTSDCGHEDQLPAPW